MDDKPARLELEYAEPPRWHQRRGRRWLVLIPLVALALWGAWRLSRGPIERFQQKREVWSMLRACKADAPGKDVVAFEGDAQRGAALGQRPGYLAYVGGRAGRVPMYCYMMLGGGWDRHGVPLSTDPVLFVHGRKAAGGRERLVVVRSMQRFVGTRVYSQLWAAVMDADVPFGERPVERSTWLGPVLSDDPMDGGNGMRIFAGQVDPGDPSHFTIEYEIDERRGVIDGWLRAGPDGEKVVLKVRE